MRITGGTLKGRNLKCPDGIIRPAMDKMKESVFSIIGDLSGKTFLDLFSGSGSIGLEAWSRGAEKVICIEKDKIKIPTILENMKLADDRITCKFLACELFIKRNKESFDFIFCDPPFPYQFHKDLVASCSINHTLKENGVLLIHHPSEKKLPETIDQFKRVDQRNFGRSIVDFYKSAY